MKTDKATAWTHENDCIMNDPMTNKPLTGFRIYKGGYLIGELYHMDENDKNKILKAVNAHDALVEALEEVLFHDRDNILPSSKDKIVDALKLAKGGE